MPPNRGPTCEITHVGRESISISLAGALDVAREYELLNLVVTLDFRPATRVELDLSDVTFADSAGVRSIVSTQAYLQGRRCQLQLLRPRRQLLEMIDVVGVSDVLTIVEDEPGAPSSRVVHGGEAAT